MGLRSARPTVEMTGFGGGVDRGEKEGASFSRAFSFLVALWPGWSVPGAEARFVVEWGAKAEALAYLRGKGGKQILCEDDSKKGNSKGRDRSRSFAALRMTNAWGCEVRGLRSR